MMQSLLPSFYTVAIDAGHGGRDAGCSELIHQSKKVISI